MRQIFQSIAGGIFIIVSSGVFWLFEVRRFFIWVLAWPTLILHPFLPKPAPDQIFPLVGGAGIFITLIVATLSYSILIYFVLWLRGRSQRLP